MDKIQIYGLLFNIILYIIITIPIYTLSFFKKAYENKKIFIVTFIFSIIYFVIISILLYYFPYKVFSLFTNTKGVINYSVYAFRILFACSSLFAAKILIPKYIINQTPNKKIATFYYSKIAITFILSIIGYFIFDTKGILFAFPLTDFIYSITYLYLFFKYY